MTDPTPDYATAAEIALMLNCTTQTVYRLCAARRIPYIRLGGKRGSYRFDPAAVRMAMDRHAVSAVRQLSGEELGSIMRRAAIRAGV